MKKTPRKTPRAAAQRRGKGAGAPSAGFELALADAEQDDLHPDVAPDALALHAEELATTVRGRHKALAKAKVTNDDAALLDALAKELRRRETAWRSHWTGGGAKDVAKARFEAVKGRRDLFSALRTFAEHDLDTQAELDDVANVENDADLLQDLDRLATLAAKHEGDLAGTDVDAARVAQVAAATERFRVARAGAGSSGEDEGAAARENAAARTEKGQGLLRARNRAFWAVAKVDRRVCARGRHLYRHDPKVLGAFGAYTTTRGGGAGGEKKAGAEEKKAGEKK